MIHCAKLQLYLDFQFPGCTADQRIGDSAYSGLIYRHENVPRLENLATFDRSGSDRP
jgi:hypothetical protein